ncbi:hypothetical protein GVAV_000889 [Gurleya vavrai]
MTETAEKLSRFFIQQFKKKQNLSKTHFSLLEELNSLSKHKESLIELRMYLEENEIPVYSQFPVIIGNAFTRMSILDLGRLPDVNDLNGHTANYILPRGFKAKRRYNKHKNCKRNDDKVFYICNINEKGEKEISCVDGKWTDFSKFKEDVGGEIKSFEEFFGFDNPGLIKMIEGMGDISLFTSYIPMKQRGKIYEKIVVNENDSLISDESTM